MQTALHVPSSTLNRGRFTRYGLVGIIAIVLTATPTVRAAGDGRWVWPLSPRPSVVRGYDAPDPDWQRGHRGVDLAGRVGEPVLAIGRGRVAFAGQVGGRGVVVVTHGALRSTYQPILPLVAAGDRVDAGDRIGTLLATGSHCLPAVCLHLGLRRGARYVDPLSLYGPRPVRLLPTGGLAPMPQRLASGQPGSPAAGGLGAGMRVLLPRARADPSPARPTRGGALGAGMGLLVHLAQPLR